MAKEIRTSGMTTSQSECVLKWYGVFKLLRINLWL